MPGRRAPDDRGGCRHALRRALPDLPRGRGRPPDGFRRADGARGTRVRRASPTGRDLLRATCLQLGLGGTCPEGRPGDAPGAGRRRRRTDHHRVGVLHEHDPPALARGIPRDAGGGVGRTGRTACARTERVPCRPYRPSRRTRSPICRAGRLSRLVSHAARTADPRCAACRDRCCGFGGTFSGRYPDVSVAMADTKLDDAETEGVDLLVSADPGCLMQLGGRSSRRGSPVRMVHVASLLREAMPR
jgi:hypothetical protein